jgi:flagellar hook-associated protein 2
MTTRLEKRRATLESQFAAMETLVSSLNSQGDYLTSFFESYNS